MNKYEFDYLVNERANDRLIARKAFETTPSFFKKYETQPGEFVQGEIEERKQTYYNNRSNYYYPGTVIVQSSGFGKSRQLEILSKNEKNVVVYCNVIDYHKGSYPQRSFLANFLGQNGMTHEQAQNRFFFYFKYFIEEISNMRKTGKEHVEFSFSDRDENHENTLSDEKKINISDKLYELQKCENESNPTKYINHVKENKKFVDADLNLPENVLFVFDEARNLLNMETCNGRETYFTIMQSVMREVSEIQVNNQRILDKKFFGLFLDTMVSLKDYMPTIAIQQYNLLAPIYVLPTWDVFVKHDSVSSLASAVSFERIARFGRPLWFTLLSGGKTEGDLVEFAKRKLSCNIAQYESLLDGLLFPLAMIGCRVGGLLLNPTSEETSELVAGFMAINWSISDDRSNVIAGYSSEPIMCEAAAQMWNEFPRVFAKAIEIIADCVTSGIVRQDDLGELAARAIVLKAVDCANDYELFHRNENDSDEDLDSHSHSSAQQQTAHSASKNINLHYTSPVLVKSFLKSFGHRNYTSGVTQYKNDVGYKKDFDKDGLEKLLSCYILVNHFIQKTNTKNDSKKIQNFATRYGGTICKKNQWQVDLIIPVFDEQMKQQSYILIKVKFNSSGMSSEEYIHINPVSLNYETLSDEADIASKLPFIAMCIELDQFQSSCLNCVEWDLSDPFEFEPSRDQFENEIRLLQKNLESNPKLNESAKNKIRILKKKINAYDDNLENSPHFRKYIKQKQVFIYIRGIDTNNYPFLKDDGVEALKKLAFARYDPTKEIIGDYEKVFYNHIKCLYPKKIESF